MKDLEDPSIIGFILGYQSGILGSKFFKFK